MSGSAERGTTASCTARSGAIRPIAPNAFFRPCQSRARSAGVEALRTVARAALAQDATTTVADSASTASAWPSSSTSSTAAASVGIARRVDRRLDRRDAGLVHHLQRRGHDARGDDRGDRLAGGAHGRRSRPAACGRSAGSGASRTVISSAIPNIPSLPTKSPTRSGPHGSPCGEPSRTTEPSGSTTSSSTTWLVVTPYLRQCGPPAFSATLPPTVQAVWLDGSGA